MESIAADIRRGIPWVVVPLALASAFRLGLEPGYLTLPFFGWLLLIVAFALSHRWLLRDPSPCRIRVSVGANFLAINIGYLALGAALQSHAGWRADDLVYSIDCALFHGDPQRLLAPLRTPWVSSATMLGYLGFFGFLLYLFLSEAVRLSAATGKLQLGLMRLYGLGFAGYLLLPAAGPAFHHPALLGPIHHSTFSAALQPWVLGNCSRVDVCPSIHAAVCAFTLAWTYRRRPLLFPFLLAPSVALVLGTVYLQYHYFLDLPFGLMLGVGTVRSISHALPSTVLRSAGAAG